MSRELDEFQHEVIAAANVRGRLIYADPVGSRKTATTLAFLRQRETANRICLVVPGAVTKHWHEEAAEWYPRALVAWGNTAATRARCLGEVVTSNGPAIYITTYDAMKVDSAALEHAHFDTWVFDEGHRLKGRTTAVAKTAYRLTKGASNILCVTATPVLNAPEELWFYLHLLFRKSFTSFWKWAEEHFIVKAEFYNGRAVKVIKGYQPGHDKLVRNILARCCIQREIETLYPEATWTEEPEFIPHYVELNDEERRHYDKLVKHAWSQFPGRVVTAGNKLVVSTRLRQLVSDWGNLDVSLEHGSKVEAAFDLVVEHAKRRVPVVVFTEYIETAERLRKELEYHGISAGLYTGKQSQDQRDNAKGLFRDGMLDCIIGTYGSMMEGVDGLQLASHTMILVDLLWVYELVKQAIGRLRRDGQTQTVQVHLIVAKDTIDATVLRANLRKVNVVKTLKGQKLNDIVFGINPDIDVLEDA